MGGKRRIERKGEKKGKEKKTGEGKEREKARGSLITCASSV